jgi:uncharacterized protein (UPF0218 family)
MIDHQKPTKLFAIGDVVASNIIKNNIPVDFIVIDFKSKRQPFEPISLCDFDVIRVKNPPGVITQAAYEAIQAVCSRCVSSVSSIAIVVDGEEDLLTLPVVKFAPLGALIVYGQPYVGIVVVNVTKKMKLEIEQLMKKMVFTYIDAFFEKG